jgi:hypothetical protein
MSSFVAFVTLCSMFDDTGLNELRDGINERDVMDSGIRTEVNGGNEENSIAFPLVVCQSPVEPLFGAARFLQTRFRPRKN